MSDRTVHAQKNRDGRLYEIVRYDRSGKWWLEMDGERTPFKRIDDAVKLAVDGGYLLHTGRSGGLSFDSRCTARLRLRRDCGEETG